MMRPLLRSFACVVAALTACAGGPVGRSVACEADVLSALGPGAVIGRFDVAFPATIVRVVTSDEALQFEHAGAQHQYPALLDSSLRAVFVESPRGEGVIVVRSELQS
ncbi:MAG TPA: hypothetical protein VFZ65_11215 [Planctomycetota bacterium]|nr:hypothetical protein [Planctomycetota bacterium]